MPSPVLATSFQLIRRPSGMPSPEDFELVSSHLALDAPDRLLVENLLFSVDPYHRQSMDEIWELHAPLEGRSIGRVVDSSTAGIEVGALVVHRRAYATHAIVDAAEARVLDPAEGVPLSAYLGVLGGTGLTAYVGLTHVAPVRPGDRVLITAAGGAVGSVGGHIARLLGASAVVGVTGRPAKARRLLDGPFDAVLDYRARPVAERLAELEPFDVALEGVGGEQLEAVIEAMRPGGRIAWVGHIADYNLAEPPAAPRNLARLIESEIALDGYLVARHLDLREEYEAFMIPQLRSGAVPVDETVAFGVERAIDALIAVLRGENFGKQLVDLR